MNTLTDRDLYKYVEAINYAIFAHNGQFRKFGNKEPYVRHPIRVSQKILTITEDLDGAFRSKLAVAGVLHDVIEDTQFKGDSISTYFGREVALLVESVTKNTALAKADKEMDFLLRFKGAGLETVLIKLADRLDNLESMRTAPTDFQKKYLSNTEQLLSAIPKDLIIDEHVERLLTPILRIVDEYTNTRILPQ